MMRSHELRHDIFVCGMILRLIRRQIKQGIVIEEGKVWAALRHGFLVAGNLKVWMIMIPLLIENTATRVASGTCCSGTGCCRVSGGRPGPVLHIPFHTGQSEWKTGSGVQVRGTCSSIWRVEIKQAERRPVKIQNSIIRYDRAVIYSYFRLNFLLSVHLRDMRKAFSLYLWDEPGRNGTVLKPSPT